MGTLPAGSSSGFATACMVKYLCVSSRHGLCRVGGGHARPFHHSWPRDTRRYVKGPPHQKVSHPSPYRSECGHIHRS